jgi:hypothetical protein
MRLLFALVIVFAVAAAPPAEACQPVSPGTCPVDPAASHPQANVLGALVGLGFVLLTAVGIWATAPAAKAPAVRGTPAPVPAPPRPGGLVLLRF